MYEFNPRRTPAPKLHAQAFRRLTQETMKILYIILLSISVVSCAAPTKDLSGFANSVSYGLNLPEYSASDLENPRFKIKVAFVFSVLYNTVELNTHRMNGQVDNQVFVHEQGGEAVYDKNGDLVSECENMGSYNYAHYKRAPLAHFSVDILPWLRWGNCREDTTTINQRIQAYMLDFENGFEIAASDSRGYFLPQKFDLSQPVHSVAIAFFLAAFERSGFDLYTFIMYNQHNEQERIRFIEALENGFIRHFDKV